MRVAVIGAGSAGLTAIKNCLAHVQPDDSTNNRKIHEVVCFEKTDNIGGTWVYTPETGVDKYGLPIHSSMYDSLRTNLPKEVMRYSDFPFCEGAIRSYMTRTEVLDFLNDYCDHFQLRSHIRFLHHVELVKPTVGSPTQWEVTVKDLKKNSTSVEVFDAVMVCNGHYFQPNLPKIQGQDKFIGKQLHSHDYRVPDVFVDKIVLIIGAGPSGMDLALEIAKKASKVILSHHHHDQIHTVFPGNVVQTHDVEKMDETNVTFQDGRVEKPDVIFYCTGYKYSFPFLDESCGVRVDNNMVTPLWKHLLSIENSTLAFICLPFYVCAFSMSDLQAQFVLKYWLKEKELPGKEIMLAEEASELAQKKEKNLSKRHFHMMGPEQGDYYSDLAGTAGVTPIPPVLTKIHNDSSMRFDADLVHYREDRYKVVDDFNFIKL